MNNSFPIRHSNIRSAFFHWLLCPAIILCFAHIAVAVKPSPTPTPTATPDGDLGNGNTVEGAGALASNVGGINNTALGFDTLFNNINGSNNTATGFQSLFSNTSGDQNTATGASALYNNIDGGFNTAYGFQALTVNTSGNFNTADGYQALPINSTGSQNVAVGGFALDSCVIGNSNIAVGYLAGLNTDGDNNIVIGNSGVNGESNTIRVGTSQTATFVAGISGVPVIGDPVLVNGNGQLGTLASSERFKHQVQPMNDASAAIFDLKPVSFRYNQEIDPNESPRFGLVAEDVEKVDPDLVVHDSTGKIYSVRYEAVNAMLLNEFLKEHRRVEELETAVKQLKAAVDKNKKSPVTNHRSDPNR